VDTIGERGCTSMTGAYSFLLGLGAMFKHNRGLKEPVNFEVERYPVGGSGSVYQA